MILELDVGNSRIKWRCLDPQSGTESDISYAQDQTELFKGLKTISAPLMVRMSSVRGGETNDAIEKWTDERWSLPVHIARVGQSVGGVRIQYADLTRLGVDRWLAMLTAYRSAGGACVIVDSGTALTIDVLDRQGLHKGGFIIPGLKLMRDSLERHTRIRLSKQGCMGSITLGNSTDSAVCNGTLAAQVSLINKVIAESLAIDGAARIFFAGGDAELLAAQAIADEYEISPCLVLDGLAIACPFSGEL